MNKRSCSLLLLIVILIFACNLPSFIPSGITKTPISTSEEKFEGTATALGYDATATAIMKGANPTALSQSANATGTAMAYNALATAQAANATAQAGSANATSLALAVSATTLAQAATLTAQAIPPTLPPPPPLPPLETMVRISFPSGATSASVAGILKKNSPIDYGLRALQGQTMIISVSSPGDNVYLGVTGLTDGIPLLRTVAGSTQFSGVLPLTQDYRLTLIAPVQKSSFNMQAIIPARIKFQPGAISATLQGKVIERSVNHYLLNAMSGQNMTVNIFSPYSDVFITIYGVQDGIPLVRSVAEATTWSGILPNTQDYMIEAVSVGGTANYTLQVTVQ